MKTLVLVLLALLITSVAFAELTTKEEEDIRALLTKQVTLTALADNATSETLPLEIAVLRQERTALIEERNVLLTAEDGKANSAKQTIIDTYEIQIDAKEAEISAKEAELNAII